MLTPSCRRARGGIIAKLSFRHAGCIRMGYAAVGAVGLSAARRGSMPGMGGVRLAVPKCGGRAADPTSHLPWGGSGGPLARPQESPAPSAPGGRGGDWSRGKRTDTPPEGRCVRFVICCAAGVIG